MDALDALAYAVERRKVSWIVEVDIREFFGSIDREAADVVSGDAHRGRQRVSCA